MTDDDLIRAAALVRERAYAPYSRFLVGAAILDERGAVHAGANVENASYGLTICAERAAAARMIADGGRRIVRIAIVTGTPRPTPPCGACRQVIRELGPDAHVILANPAGVVVHHPIGDLLPESFGPEDLA